MQSLTAQQFRELTLLIDQFLDESISDEGMLALSNALKGSAEVRRYFLQYAQLHLDLGTEAEVEKHSVASFDEFSRRCDKIALRLREQSALPGQGPHSRSVREPRLRSTFAYAAALGFLFLLGSLSTVLYYELRGKLSSQEGLDLVATQRSSAESSVSAIPTVAHLTYVNGCSWGGGLPTGRAIDSSVHLGEELVLHEGIAEFRLSSGVSLSIEGPCSVVITSPSSIVLQHGRVTAYVPWSVAEFQLVAAACRISASDAEFGAYVSGGKVKLHTFSGHVVMDASNADDSLASETEMGPIEDEQLLPRNASLARVVIHPGRALAVDSEEDRAIVSAWESADATQFATKLSMAGNLQISEEYVRTVLASTPVDYWRFEGDEGGLVVNEFPSRPALEIVGDLRFAGDSLNRVIELGRPGANGYLRCTEMLEIPEGDYSVEIWAKPSHAHVGGIVGMFTELPVGVREQLAFYLQVCGTQSMWGTEGQRKFRYLHRNPPGYLHETGTSCYSEEHYKIRRWHHLAAVKEGSAMKLYVDGHLSSEEKEETPLPSKLGLLVGQLTAPRHVGRFIGQLDEMAIYHRALTPEEIRLRIKSVEAKNELEYLPARLSFSPPPLEAPVEPFHLYDSQHDLSPPR